VTRKATAADDPSLAVRAIIGRRVASAAAADDLADDVALGADGLGLDSVGVVELLLECEAAFGIRLPADLAESGGLTVGHLAGLVRSAIGRRNAEEGPR
jgi:acyl carrier protein